MHPTQPIPGGDQSNPYDFILNDPPKKKRNLVPKGDSKNQRLLFLIGGGLALLTLLIVIFSLIFGGSGGLDTIEKLTKEQQEIMRVAELGEKGARSIETQSFALSTKLTISTSQTTMLAYLAERGSEIKGKDLNQNIDTKTDAKLKAATDNGEFDAVFDAILTEAIQDYMQNLSEAFDAAGTKTQKTLLQNAYNEADGLIKKEPTE